MAGVLCSESMRGPWGSAKLRVSAPAEAGTPARLNANGPAAGPGYMNNRLAVRDDTALRMPARFTPKSTGSWSEGRGDVGSISYSSTLGSAELICHFCTSIGLL